MKNHSNNSQPAIGDDRFNTAGYTSDEANINDVQGKHLSNFNDKVSTSENEDASSTKP
ncbi:hypothetical protein [Priestia megaterium]|jgi:hypothetical protein|uniref:hypothetical protein n=1 Tax=Priestia megaterium TaxID=1404 RepID=UPI00186691A0|nr:hypothetical protein [Priestia megaterium]MBE2978813.1 hypothetical protein [Priestia megaterium]MCY9019404.1 hypothetical protein [Priestia megaterium]